MAVSPAIYFVGSSDFGLLERFGLTMSSSDNIDNQLERTN